MVAMSCRRPSLSHPPARGHHTGFICEGSLPPWGSAGERSELFIKPRLVAPQLIFPLGYILKSISLVDTSARQRGFEFRVFLLLGELSEAIEPHLPVCQLCRRQLRPNMWSSPTTKSLDPIVATARRVGFPWGKPRTRHMWICLQLSGARGVGNGGVRALNIYKLFIEL